MKTNTTNHRACLSLPGTAALATSSHDSPNVMQPVSPLRRILTGLAAALALGLFAIPGVSRADSVQWWRIFNGNTESLDHDRTVTGELTVGWGSAGTLNHTAGLITFAAPYGLNIGNGMVGTYNMSGTASINTLGAGDPTVHFGKQGAGGCTWNLSGQATATVRGLDFQTTSSYISFATGSTATLTVTGAHNYATLVGSGNIRIDGAPATWDKFQVSGNTLSLAPPPTKLDITVPPTGTVGSPFSVTVQAKDAGGTAQNVTSDTTVTLTQASGGGTLSGTLAGVISNGTSSVTISGALYDVVDTMTVTASATSGMTLTPITSSGITFAAAYVPPTKLAYKTVPATGTAGTAFSVTVEARDSGDTVRPVSSDTTVTLSQASGGGTLSGTLTGIIPSGSTEVTISTPVYSKSDTMTLTATPTLGMTGLTPLTSGNIAFTPGALDHFTITPTITSPQTAGTPITGLTLTALDAYGNTCDSGVNAFNGTVTYSGTAGITGTSGAFTAGVLSGASVTPTVAGSGKTFIVTGSTKTGTSTFDVNSGVASALLITTPPSGGQPGVAWATQPTVQVMDAVGNIVSNSDASITLTITTGTPASGGIGSILIGTTTVSAVNGVATFSGLSIDTAGVGYRLTASSGVLTPADSALFSVTAGTVLYDSTACSGNFPKKTLNFTPVAGHVYTLSFSLNNPTNSVVNCLIGLSPKTLADNSYSDGTLIDGFWNSSGGTIARQYNGGGNGTAFTSTGSGNGYRGSHGVLISNYEVVLDTTAVTWKTSTSMSSALGTVSGAAFTAVGTTRSVQVWVRDGGNGIYPTISNFRLTDTNVAASLTQTTTTLARSSGTVTPSNYNDSLSFDVAVSPSTATGTVQLYDGGVSGTLIGTGTLSGGTCTITPATTALALGTHANIVAVYIGDTTYGTSTSVALSPAQVVNSGVATALLIPTPPSGAQPGVAWATQPTVQVLDAAGNIVSNSDASITLTITSGTPATGGAGTLIGTTTVSAVNGVATFSGLSIDTAGVGYRLTASSGVLTPADSALFSVTAGTVLYDSTACSGNFPKKTLNFTPVAGHVYTLSFSLNNPTNSVVNCLIGLSPKTLADNSYSDGTLIDGFWNSSGGTIARQYNGGGNGTAFTSTGSGNGYRGSHGVLISNYEVVLDTTAETWTTSTSMSSALGTVSGAALNAVGTTKSVQVWVRDPGNSIYPTISNFRLTDTAVIVTPTYASWATTNSVSSTPSADSNNDGVQNGVAYFMNATGVTTNPGIIGNAVTWPNGGNIPSTEYGADKQFVVQTSLDLVNWADVEIGDLTTNTSGPSGELTYTLPTSVLGGKLFTRLVITPN